MRLGGFVLLPRVLDKCRASLAGKNGEYNFNCPLDQRFFAFVQADADAFKQQVKSGAGDSEMFEWVLNNSKARPGDLDIVAWSAQQEQRVPSDPESRALFNELHKKAAPQRNDISTWFDLLDVDDYANFGGKT